MNKTGAYDFIIYTDGSCQNGSTGPGGYGVIIINTHSDKEYELSGGFQKATNNQMEVYAAIISLKDLPSKVSVQLNSDSEYLVKTMNGEFKRKKNIEYWDALDAALEGKTVYWEWVRGHAGNEYNERCDKLAVQASQRPDLPYEAIPARIDEVHIERKVLRKEAKSQPLNQKPQKCYRNGNVVRILRN